MPNFAVLKQQRKAQTGMRCFDLLPWADLGRLYDM